MALLTHGEVLARFGHALSDPTRARVLLALREAPAYPSELADALGVSRQSLSNHLACLRGCGLVVAVPESRRVRYELADHHLTHALGNLLGVVLAIDPDAYDDATRGEGLLLMAVTPADRSPARRDALARRVRHLVSATITYNVAEAVIALSAGVVASSTALVGFGLDSLVEVSSAAAVAWQFSARDHEVRDAREHTALRITAVSFFALAAFVTADAVRSLLGTGGARPSPVGIGLAALSLVVMPCLSVAQRRAGRQLGSASAVADAKQELLCTYLAAVLLVGLVVNAVLGWTWADPVAGLVIAAIAVKEGRDAWRGDACCADLDQRTTEDTECRTSCELGCLCCS